MDGTDSIDTVTNSIQRSERNQNQCGFRLNRDLLSCDNIFMELSLQNGNPADRLHGRWSLRPT
jgi:hypothetical protein